MPDILGITARKRSLLYAAGCWIECARDIDVFYKVSGALVDQVARVDTKLVGTSIVARGATGCDRSLRRVLI